MTDRRTLQRIFDGTDTTLAWQHVLDYSHHSPEPTDYYYNCFYVCPEDKAVEIEIVQLQCYFKYNSTYMGPEAWICLFPAATSSDAWMHGTYDRRHYDRASVARYSNTATNESRFATYPTIDAQYQVTLPYEKIKLNPGDRLVAYVYSPEIEWGSVAYSTYFEPLDRHFTFNAIVYEEDVEIEESITCQWSITPTDSTVWQNAGTLAFTVTRSCSSYDVESVVYISTSNDVGHGNINDYVELTNVPLHFGIGETSKSVEVEILDIPPYVWEDPSVFSDATFRVTVHPSVLENIATSYLTRTTFTIRPIITTPIYFGIVWPHNEAYNQSDPLSLPRGTISSGGNHFIFKTNGTLWGWGGNQKGSLGIGNTASKLTPVQIGTSTDWKQIDGCGESTAGIKNNGTLWVWGNCSFFSLNTWIDSILYSTPVQVGVGTNWKHISVQSSLIAAIKTDGTLWVAGRNGFNGRLGLGLSDPNAHISSLTQVGTLTNWKQVEVMGEGMYAVKDDGTLWAWGDISPYSDDPPGSVWVGNNAGSSPIQIGSDIDWKEIVRVGSGVLELRKNDGSFWAWNDSTSPSKISNITDWKANGAEYGIKGNGNIVTYGYWSNYPISNYYGYAAVQGTIMRDPDEFACKEWLMTGDWEKMSSCPGDTIHLIKTDGTLWAMGMNDLGGLGIGTTDNIVRSSPVQVGSMTDWASFPKMC